VAGRGAAFGDLNNDGVMDAVVAALGGRPFILMGRPSSNHWLTLELTGTKSNRDAQGAAVRTGKQLVYATTSGSYLSASDGRVHFGLGTGGEATVEITWPGGKRQIIEKMPANRITKIREPE
jgi:hypothetical protein